MAWDVPSGVVAFQVSYNYCSLTGGHQGGGGRMFNASGHDLVFLDEREEDKFGALGSSISHMISSSITLDPSPAALTLPT